MSQLSELKDMTVVVADTGDFNAIKEYEPRDATTNPSLLLKATQQEEYKPLIDEAIAYANEKGNGADRVELCLNKLAVIFGREILNVVPGRVSTETDAASSFDTDKLVAEGRKFIELYEEMGIERERVLIKIASTWEGIKAGEILEKEGIHCNLTLMFNLAQAIACAEGGITLISPFVGRIYDWYKKELGKEIPATEDPGVESVTTIYNYFRKFGFKTEVMGASFRNTGQIIELAGCDLLTISPDLLDDLSKADGPIERKLEPEAAKSSDIERIDMTEATFRWMVNEDAMATEKLAEGIRKFNADWVKLRKTIAAQIGEVVTA